MQCILCVIVYISRWLWLLPSLERFPQLNKMKRFKIVAVSMKWRPLQSRMWQVTVHVHVVSKHGVPLTRQNVDNTWQTNIDNPFSFQWIKWLVFIYLHHRYKKFVACTCTGGRICILPQSAVDSTWAAASDNSTYQRNSESWRLQLRYHPAGNHVQSGTVLHWHRPTGEYVASFINVFLIYVSAYVGVGPWALCWFMKKVSRRQDSVRCISPKCVDTWLLQWRCCLHCHAVESHASEIQTYRCENIFDVEVVMQGHTPEGQCMESRRYSKVGLIFTV